MRVVAIKSCPRPRTYLGVRNEERAGAGAPSALHGDAVGRDMSSELAKIGRQDALTCGYEGDLLSSKEGAKLEHRVKIRSGCPSCAVPLSPSGSGSPSRRKLQGKMGSVCSVVALSPSCLG